MPVSLERIIFLWILQHGVVVTVFIALGGLCGMKPHSLLEASEEV